MTVEDLIKEKAKTLASTVYVAPSIPEKKLNNAIVGMTGSAIDPDYVVAVIDATLFGKCDDGVLFTGDTMYWHPFCSDIRKIKFSDMKSATMEIEKKTDNKGKVKETQIFHLVGKDDNVIVHTSTGDFKVREMVDFLNEIIKLGEDSDGVFESTKQILSLCDTGSEIKLPYMKIVVNFALSDDKTVDGEEYSSIYNLMVRNNFSNEDRVVMRSYMFDSARQEPTDKLVESLRAAVPYGSFKTTAISLIKDCVYLNYKKGNSLTAWKEIGFINDLKTCLSVDDEQIDLVVQAIINDEDILRNRKTDSQIEKSAKELAAKAGAVGVPLAALYFSGSVIGFSASGITSGLAALGLGFGMVGGIGVAILVGVAAYKGIKMLTSTGEVEACKQRELMIQNIIKNNQKTISYLVEDTNMISAKLFDVIESGNANVEEIAKLKKMLAVLTKASQSTAAGIMNGAKEEIIAKLPKTLNKSRFDRLTDSPTKIKVRQFVYEVYPEVEETKKKSDGSTYKDKTYCLDDNFPNENYERCLKILKAVEYLNKD